MKTKNWLKVFAKVLLVDLLIATVFGFIISLKNIELYEYPN